MLNPVTVRQPKRAPFPSRQSGIPKYRPGNRKRSAFTTCAIQVTFVTTATRSQRVQYSTPTLKSSHTAPVPCR